MKSKLVKISLIILIFVFLVISTFSIIFMHYYRQLDHKTESEISTTISQEEADKITKQEQDNNAINSTDKELEELNSSVNKNINSSEYDVITKDDVMNILLIGTDNRDKETSARSDAMMVLSINNKTKSIVLTSILRDVYVEIPNYGNNRLNAAYAFGGVALLKDTLKQNFKINIDRYAIVDFYDFINIVDILGGLELDISEKEMEYVNMYLHEVNLIEGNEIDHDYLTEYGNIHLNGHQALAYSRIRYIGTDFGRTERQRKVLEKLFNDIKVSSFSDLNKIYLNIAPNVTTDITESEVLGLLFNMVNYKNYKTQQNCIPYENTYEFYTVNKMSVIGIDFDKNIKRFNELVYSQ